MNLTMNFTLNLFCVYLLAFLCHVGPGPDLPCCRFEWGLLQCCQPVEPLTMFKGMFKGEQEGFLISF